MILIFGGTTEGRIAAKVCDAAGKSFFYSSKNGDQEVLAEHLIPISGAMDAEGMRQFCQEQGVELIIDAAHPFADILHRNIAATGIPCIRLERPALDLSDGNVERVDSLAAALDALPPQSRVLALTGVKSAATLQPYLATHDIKLRIMDRGDSLQQIDALQFPKESLLYYPEGGESSDELAALIKLHGIQTLICKDSGQSGGLVEKLEAAKSCGCQLYLIQRPTLPSYTQTVYGGHGLRRAIQQLLPHYYSLKTGLTTGSYATAASCAALYTLLNQRKTEGVEFILPDSEPMHLLVDECQFSPHEAEARFIKDSGDDPCVIHGLELGARVRLLPEAGIVLKGGEGVGRATLPGLDFPVGEAAINKVPREMILQNVLRILKDYGVTGGVEIEIFIPRGAEAAKKTLNERWGIVNGLSILGTSGIVQPFSAEAFLASLERQIQIVKALGHDSIALNSGAKSERYMRSYLPELDEICLLHYGNLIGDSLSICADKGMHQVHLGLMIGKAVKLAKGAMDTHNQQCRMDKSFIKELAQECGCDDTMLAAIESMHSARELWDIIPQDSPFFYHIARLCHDQASSVFPSENLQVLLIAEGGQHIISYPN